LNKGEGGEKLFPLFSDEGKGEKGGGKVQGEKKNFHQHSRGGGFGFHEMEGLCARRKETPETFFVTEGRGGKAEKKAWLHNLQGGKKEKKKEKGGDLGGGRGRHLTSFPREKGERGKMISLKEGREVREGKRGALSNLYEGGGKGKGGVLYMRSI